MTRQRYSIRESLNKILRLFQGETINEAPTVISGQILSVDEAMSDFTELLNDSLPGQTFALPTAVSNTLTVYANPDDVSQAEAEAGTEAENRSWSPLRVRQAAAALGGAVPEYGGLFVHTGTASQTPGTSFAKVTQFTTNGDSSTNVTPDNSTDVVSIGADATGIYWIFVQVSFTGSNSSIVSLQVFGDGNAITSLAAQRKLGNGVDVGSFSLGGVYNISSAQDIDLRVKCDGASDVFDVKECQFFLHRISSD